MNSERKPLRWLVFPSFDQGTETRIEAAGGAEQLFAMSAASLNLDIWTDRGLLFFRDLLETTPVSRLQIGSVPDAAELLMAMAPKVMGGGEPNGR